VEKDNKMVKTQRTEESTKSKKQAVVVAEEEVDAGRTEAPSSY